MCHEKEKSYKVFGYYVTFIASISNWRKRVGFCTFLGARKMPVFSNIFNVECIYLVLLQSKKANTIEYFLQLLLGTNRAA